jgi:hypothetical protein
MMKTTTFITSINSKLESSFQSIHNKRMKNKKAFIDRKNNELITIGFDPEWAAEKVKEQGLDRWGWIDDNDRDIPASWEAVELPA